MNLCICLAGNPNSGKTTLFNELTGARQRVGNWPGVTIEKKSGLFNYQDQTIEVIDLPGIYSLNVISETGSLDERIACEFIQKREANIVVNILDATNLERNLYLTFQLLEMQVPMIIVVNMIDIAKQRGLSIDIEKLQKFTQCPIIPIIARNGIGLDELKKTIVQFNALTQPQFTYNSELESSIQRITAVLPLNETISSRWLAIRLLENDIYAKYLLHDQENVFKVVADEQARLEQLEALAEIQLAEARYQWISDIAEVCCKHTKNTRRHLTDWIDHIVLNRWLGIPIFLCMMYLMFEFSITFGGALQPLFDDISHLLFIDGIDYLGNLLGFPIWLTALGAHGIGLGLNTVFSFIPQIAALFLFLSFIEDSGYMTRAAFVMDRFMQAVGLPGKSFVSLIVGFGCNVPAIMATRTLDTRRDRLLTIMMAPFMSCGARLAIFAVFSSAFFPEGGALIVFLLYVIGIGVGILTALIIKHTFLKGKPSPFIMELPPYHLPNNKTLWIHTWQRLQGFVWRAGKIIVPICVLIGSLNAIEINGSVKPNGSHESILANISQIITPVFYPMGITEDNWPATVGLVTGTLAKEVVVGTLNTLYSQEQLDTRTVTQFNLWDGLKQAWQNTYQGLSNLTHASFANPFTANEADHSMSDSAMGTMVLRFGSLSAAFAYMLFVLLYIPCISTIAATMREANKVWALLSAWWSLSIAYGLAVIIYQALNYTNHIFSSIAWITGMLLYLAGTIYAMHYYADHEAFSSTPLPLGKSCRACPVKGSCHQ